MQESLMRQRNGERSAERNLQGGGPVPSYWSQPRTDITPLREGGATSQQVQCMPRLFDRSNRVQNSLSSPSDIHEHCGTRGLCTSDVRI